MRTSVLIAIDSQGKSSLVAGTEVSVVAQKKQFRKLQSEKPEGVSEIHLYTSGGVKKRKFNSVEVQEPKAPKAKEPKAPKA